MRPTSSERPATLSGSSGTTLRRAGRAAAWLGISLLSALLVVEVGVRWLEHRGAIGEARADRLEEAYQSSAFRLDGLGDAGYLAPGFSGRVKNEFGKPVEWTHNSFGFRTREEISRRRPPGVFRILMLGDSFVAGHRLGQEQTVGYRLESWLRDNGFPGCEVLISAIEEPAVGLEYLEAFGLSFEPQSVLLGVTLGNDLAQTYASLEGDSRRYDLTTGESGGDAPAIVERAQWDQQAQRRHIRSLRIPRKFLTGAGRPPDEPAETADTEPRPWYELRYLGLIRDALGQRRARNAPQAVRSYWNEYHEPRLIDGNGIAMHLDPAPPEVERSYQLLFDLLRRYHRVCVRHGIRFGIMVHAQRYQVQPRDLEATIQTYALRPSHFELMGPNRRIAEFCRREGIPCLDPTEEMATAHERSGEQFFMPHGDMHWNAAGAEAFFEGLQDQLAAELKRP